MRSIEKTNSGKSCRGFTLVEMAIVIIILGLGLAAFGPVYKLYLKDQAEKTTGNNIERVNAAISGFRSLYGRYPFPASLTAVNGDVDYGREQALQSASAPGSLDPALGVYIQQAIPSRTLSYRNPWVAGNPVIVPPARPRVRIGAIPFRQLHIDEKFAYDGYGNRLMYAITEHLANDQTFNPTQGGIDIIDGTGATVVPDTTLPPVPPPPGGTAHFAIFSMGENANGAFTAGNLATRLPCAPAAGGNLENENCDLTTTDAVFRVTQTSTQAGAGAYDDVVSYFTQSEVPLWQISNAPPGAGVIPNSIVQKPGGNVGVAFTVVAGLVPVRGTVNAELRALDDPLTLGTTEGNVMSSQLCSNNNPGCFTTDLIAGQIAQGKGLRCPKATDPPGAIYMVGIANNQPVCSNTISAKCGPGQIMIGIDVSGNVECSSAPCSTGQITLCTSNDATLAGGSVGTIRTVTAGASRSAQYRCDNVGNNPTWTRIAGPTGSCTCTPLTETQTVGCGKGFTGTLTQTRNYQCPAGTWTTWSPPVGNSYPAGAGCTCTGATDSQTATCPSGWAGTWPQTRNFNCSGTTSGSWSAWAPAAPPPGACACAAETQTRMVACGGVLTGTKRQINDKTCTPTGVNWSGWRDDPDTSANTCACTPNSYVSDDACTVAGEIGYLKNRHTITCSSPTVGQETITLITDNCNPPPGVTCRWETDNPASGYGAAKGKKLGSACDCVTNKGRKFGCYEGKNPTYTLYSGCVCRP